MDATTTPQAQPGEPKPAPCPLCCHAGRQAVHAHRRYFYHCRECDLVWVPATQHIDVDAERARYLTHNNTIDNAGYAAMLSRPIESLRKHDPDARRILDYGSGPAPVFVELLHRAGYDAVGYDPLFSPDVDLSRPFDAVVSIETFEHFAGPRAEIDRIGTLLRPGGCLVIMTRFHSGPEMIADWWYARDVTHVAFYSDTTIDWICRVLGFTLIDAPEVSIRVLRRC